MKAKLPTVPNLDSHAFHRQRADRLAGAGSEIRQSPSRLAVVWTTPYHMSNGMLQNIVPSSGTGRLETLLQCGAGIERCQEYVAL